MNRISFALALGMAHTVLLSGVVLRADPAQLPQGPLVAPNPDFSAWKIDYSYASDTDKTAKPPPSSPHIPGSISLLPLRSLTITWTKPLWHSVAIDTAGGKIEQWSDGSVHLFSDDGSPPAFSPTGFVPSEVGAKLFDFSSQKFPDMNWISPAAFVGMESVNGHSCIVFEKGGVKAWIDLQTRVPVQWKRGNETRIFEALPPPAGLLALPPEFGKVSAAIHHDEALLSRPIP